MQQGQKMLVTDKGLQPLTSLATCKYAYLDARLISTVLPHIFPIPGQETDKSSRTATFVWQDRTLYMRIEMTELAGSVCTVTPREEGEVMDVVFDFPQVRVKGTVEVNRRGGVYQAIYLDGVVEENGSK